VRHVGAACSQGGRHLACCGHLQAASVAAHDVLRLQRPNPFTHPRAAELGAGLAGSLALDTTDACAPVFTNVDVLGGANIAVCEEHVEQAIAFLEEEGTIFRCV